MDNLPKKLPGGNIPGPCTNYYLYTLISSNVSKCTQESVSCPFPFRFCPFLFSFTSFPWFPCQTFFGSKKSTTKFCLDCYGGLIKSPISYFQNHNKCLICLSRVLSHMTGLEIFMASNNKVYFHAQGGFCSHMKFH